MNDINSSIICHKLEVGANMGACIPILGTQVILGRLLGGMIQTVIGVGLWTIGQIGDLFSETKYLMPLSRIWQVLIDEGAEHSKHGPLNVGTAISQLIIGLFTLNLGNLFVHLYLKGNFDPFIPYKGVKVANSYAHSPSMHSPSNRSLRIRN